MSVFKSTRFLSLASRGKRKKKTAISSLPLHLEKKDFLKISTLPSSCTIHGDFVLTEGSVDSGGQSAWARSESEEGEAKLCRRMLRAPCDSASLQGQRRWDPRLG